MPRPHLQVIIASTREGRAGPAVAEWFVERAKRHEKFDVELVDLAKVNLPLLDEPQHPRLQQYEHEHTKAWSATITRGDAFVVVTPEYDYFPPASIVNAMQYLVQEWKYKAMGFVSYGGVSGGTRSVQGIKPLATSLKIVPMLEAVALPFFMQHIDKATNVFTPPETQDQASTVMLDELVRWTEALAVLRA